MSEPECCVDDCESMGAPEYASNYDAVNLFMKFESD